MEDWRIINQEHYLIGLTLFKIQFPNFWEKSLKQENKFYKLVTEDAYDFVNKYKRGNEYLNKEKIQDFWHTHCDFCTQKITTRENMTVYATCDFSIWICEDCFNDFKERFNWKVIDL